MAEQKSTPAARAAALDKPSEYERVVRIETGAFDVISNPAYAQQAIDAFNIMANDDGVLKLGDVVVQRIQHVVGQHADFTITGTGVVPDREAEPPAEQVV